jgi:hypothetical protein
VCSFPEWQPPSEAQGGGAQLQGTAGSAAGQQYYDGSSGAQGYQDAQQPAPGAGAAAGYHRQIGGAPIVDRYGQREPDYSYYHTG